MDKKYQLSTDLYPSLGGTKDVHRIQALRSFGDVRKGDLGGFIESEKNLSQEGNCWIYDKATVMDNAQVSGNAQVRDDETLISGNAKIRDNAYISANAQVYGNAEVFDDAEITGDIFLCDNAKVSGTAVVVGDNGAVFGNAQVKGNSVLIGPSYAEGNAILDGVIVRGFNKIDENVRVINERHPNGQLAKVALYNKEGQPVGNHLSWFDNRQLQSDVHYNDEGQRNGLSSYWDNNGTLLQEWNYKNGILDGEQHTWCSDGHEESFAIFKDGKRNGPFIFYTNHQRDNTDNSRISCHYENGLIEGRCSIYNRDGRLEARLNYKHGKLFGSSEYYELGENGEILRTKEVCFKDGVQISPDVPLKSASEIFEEQMKQEESRDEHRGITL